MQNIVAQLDRHVNKIISTATIVRSATTPKPLSRDIPLLRRLKWFHSKGLQCYYTKEQWLRVLKEDYSSEPSYEAFKRRRQKLERLGWVQCWYVDGNRNRCKGVFITPAGLKALKDYKPSRKQNAKSDPTKGSVLIISDVKSDPTTCKKRSDDMQKVIRPLNHAERSDNHAKAFNELQIKNPKKYDFMMRLVSWGIHPHLAYKIIHTVPKETTGWAYDKTIQKTRNNPGAYFHTLIKNSGYFYDC